MGINNTNIDWGIKNLKTWNPIVGCRHSCYYCYAKRLNDRFHFIEKWNEPKFFPERLILPSKVKKPSTIFVGSMCDLFGEWVLTDWIRKVIEIAEENQHHKFMFLTKNPIRYRKFMFPKNCWLGATVVKPNYILDKMRFVDNYNHKFLSIEPLLGDFSGIGLKKYDLIIVGAMTGQGAVKPKKEWIDSIKSDKIFYKENIKKYL